MGPETIISVRQPCEEAVEFSSTVRTTQVSATGATLTTRTSRAGGIAAEAGFLSHEGEVLAVGLAWGGLGRIRVSCLSKTVHAPRACL